MGLHVYESAEGIVVVWQTCLGVYPIPNFSDDWFPEAAPIFSRFVVMPTIVFAMSESIAQPIAFSTCTVPIPDAEVPDPFDAPFPLTILARSQHHTHLTVQTVLTAMSVFAFIVSTRVLSDDPSSPGLSSSSGSSITCAPGGRQFGFRLTRIPAPTPHFFTPLVSGQARDCDGVAALMLGPSGRGLRVDGHGAIYRCAPADVILPRFAGFGFGDAGLGGGSVWDGASEGSGCGRPSSAKRQNNLVSTVDFWPYRRIDSLPDELLRHTPCPANEGKDNEEVDSRLVVRFDEGMGRMVAARVCSAVGSRGAESDAKESDRWVQNCTVAVLDFV